MPQVNALNDERPCRHCGSPQHGSAGHHRLEWSQQRWEPWGIGWEHLRGMRGGHSPGDLVLALPDLVRIVPSIISGGGFRDSPVVTPAILRLWNRDPSEGLTFMLSFDSPAFTMGELESLERQLGDLGSTATVAVRFDRMSPTAARIVTPPSI